jgi:hypothetical protein
MNMVNASTGFSPFVLKSGHSPWLLPPLVGNSYEIGKQSEGCSALKLIKSIENDVLEVRDSMLAAKISQAHYTNKDHALDLTFKVGDHVMLTTAKWRREFMQAKDGRVVKFMVRNDSPYKILEAYPKSSTYKLLLPTLSKQLPTFHVSQLRPHHQNDKALFPAW